MGYTHFHLARRGEMTDYPCARDVLVATFFVLGIVSPVKELTISMSDLQRNMINYMVVCVNDYADRHGLSYVETFDYLLRNKGLDFLEDCYDAEHTLSLDTALDDLDAICKRNEGLVA